jgi:shikimate dehydrogenase
VKRVVLLGSPVAHSLSPVIQNTAFQVSGLDWCFEAIETDVEGLEPALQRMRAEAWPGANVTIPLKEAIMPLLDELDPSAADVSAVNTIVNEAGRLVGYNTDSLGFVRDLRAHWRVPGHGVAVILGAGGAARAVATGLARQGLELLLVSRSKKRGEILADDIRRKHAGEVSVLPWDGESFARVPDHCVLVVNATPLGMAPADQDSPWPAEVPLPPGAAVYDLVYTSKETRFQRYARQSGLQSMPGSGMLLEQGALSYERWTGRRAPRRQMRAALRRALERLYA